MALVAHSVRDLVEKVSHAHEVLALENSQNGPGNNGVHFTEAPLLPEGKVVFLLPGQGAQYLHMHRDLPS